MVGWFFGGFGNCLANGRIQHALPLQSFSAIQFWLKDQTLTRHFNAFYIYWWVVWNMNFIFPIILGISSSQLTLSPSFFRGVGWNHQPDLSWNTVASSWRGDIGTWAIPVLENRWVFASHHVGFSSLKNGDIHGSHPTSHLWWQVLFVMYFVTCWINGPGTVEKLVSHQLPTMILCGFHQHPQRLPPQWR